jgi:hypothetical protein
VWALAKIRFLLKPHRRIWDQNEVKELVTVLAPKNIVQLYTNGLSQGEVTSRLKTLADTIDSRGWAIKNINAEPYITPSMVDAQSHSDRLIDISNLAQATQPTDDQAVGDMLDEQTSPVAKHFSEIIGTSVRDHRERIIQEMQQAADGNYPASAAKTSPNNYWFLYEPDSKKISSSANPDDIMFRSVVVQPNSTQSDAASPNENENDSAEELRAIQTESNRVNSHLHTLSPISSVKATGFNASAGVTPTSDPAILKPTAIDETKVAELAQRDDLNVATLARLANSEEVVVELQH